MSQDIIRHPSRGPAQQQPTADDFWMQQQALAVAGQNQGGGMLPSNGNGGGGDVQPLQMVHRSLRGRYKLAVLLAAAGAMVGTAVGWSSFEKTYRAKGTVRIDPDRRYVNGTSESQLEYSRYMGSQATFIKSQDIAAEAIKRPEFRDVPGAASWDPAAFMARLTAVYASSAYDINITFDHANRDVAMAGVKAALAAYADFRDKSSQSGAENSTQFWQTRKDALTRDLAAARRRMIEVTRTDAKGDLAEALRAQTSRLAEQEAQRDDARLLLRQMTAQREQAIAHPRIASEAELMNREPFFRRLIEERDAMQLDLQRLQRVQGISSPVVVKQRDQLDGINQRIAQIAEAMSKSTYGTVNRLDKAGGVIEVTDNEIETRTRDLALLESVIETTRAAVNAASETRSTLDLLKDEITNLEGDLKLTDVKLQDAAARTLTVNAQYRTFPNPLVDVSEDKRPTMATFGFVAGGAIPLMGLVLYGLFDRKYRYSDETMQSGSTRGVPLLGILPNLPDRLSDPSQASVAAHCVHQIRTMLQLNVLGDGPSVLSVTSATSGDGKTSLSLALGLSFAASGSRTLLIDTDLIGAGLSSRLGIREPHGIGEAIASRDPMSYVRDTDVADLSVLPVGIESQQNASTFSPTAVRRLIATVRQHFDLILIDTGPVLGSIEATPVVAASDAVILTVARGQNRDLVEKAIGHLRAIGARIAGVVFNRANARDFERSISGISLRSVSRASSMNGVQSANGQRQDKRLGPLVHSVRGTKDEN